MHAYELRERRKKVIYMETLKTTTISTTLILVLLISTMLGILSIAKVDATPTIDIHMVLGPEPYWGTFSSGYHDITQAMQEEFAKIGINLIFHYYDGATISELTYVFWDSPGAPPFGWDANVGGSPWTPWGMLYVADAMMLGTEPFDGMNTAPYLNPKLDALMSASYAEFDPVKRKALIDKVQEVWRHDMAAPQMYTGKEAGVWADYFTGFDPLVAVEDAWNWVLDNNTATAPGILRIGAEIPMYGNLNPWWMTSWTTNLMNTLRYSTLWRQTRDPYPIIQNDTVGDPFHPDYLNFPCVLAPELATGLPQYSSDYLTLTVDLRDDVYWVWGNGTQGPLFNASDVEWSYNSLIDPNVGAWGQNDLSYAIDSVEVVNATRVIFHLKRPFNELTLYMADKWTAPILPKFVLKDVPPASLQGHVASSDPDAIPSLGAWLFTSWTPGDNIRLDKNPYYWGPQDPSIQTVIIKIIQDPAARLIALQNLEVDWARELVIDQATAADLKASGDFTVVKYMPCTHHSLYLNLNNQELANRYLRYAIAHAIPYPKIYNEILPAWGVEGVLTSGGMMPHWLYEGERLYNENIEPIEYDIELAQQYMDLYLNQTSGTPALGPQGDADQSGLVDLTDWTHYRTNIGTNVTTPVDIYNTWPYVVDPDWNNDNDVDLSDVAIWGLNYGTEYP